MSTRLARHSLSIPRVVPCGAYPEQQAGRPGRYTALGVQATALLHRQVQVRSLRRAERWHAHIRRDLLTMDEHLETALAFSGRLA